MKDYATLREIALNTKGALEQMHGTELGLVLIVMNQGVPQTGVVTVGNLRSSELTIRLLREIADKIERQGSSPLVIA